jgi:hypothetical protein
MAIVACAATVILLQACIYVPPVWDGSDTINLLQSIEEGKTTKAEVLEQLGEPSYRNEDQTKFKYSGHRSGGFIAIGGIGMAGAGLIDEEPWWVEIQFDDNDVVVSLKTSEIIYLTDYEVCNFATLTKNGAATWDDRWPYKKYVKEAKRRGLTPLECATEKEMLKERIALEAVAAAEKQRAGLRALAADGNAEAQFQIYKQSPPSDESFRWLCLAANQGYALAQEEMGDLNVPGRKRNWEVVGLVRPDKITASLWYSLAASNGLKRASFLRDELSKDMTDQEVAEVERLIVYWKPDPAECEIEALQIQN